MSTPKKIDVTDHIDKLYSASHLANAIVRMIDGMGPSLDNSSIAELAFLIDQRCSSVREMLETQRQDELGAVFGRAAA